MLRGGSARLGAGGVGGVGADPAPAPPAPLRPPHPHPAFPAPPAPCPPCPCPLAPAGPGFLAGPNRRRIVGQRRLQGPRLSKFTEPGPPPAPRRAAVRVVGETEAPSGPGHGHGSGLGQVARCACLRFPVGGWGGLGLGPALGSAVLAGGCPWAPVTCRAGRSAWKGHPLPRGGRPGPMGAQRGSGGRATSRRARGHFRNTVVLSVKFLENVSLPRGFEDVKCPRRTSAAGCSSHGWAHG